MSSIYFPLGFDKPLSTPWSGEMPVKSRTRTMDDGSVKVQRVTTAAWAMEAFEFRLTSEQRFELRDFWDDHEEDRFVFYHPVEENWRECMFAAAPRVIEKKPFWRATIPFRVGRKLFDHRASWRAGDTTPGVAGSTTMHIEEDI